MCLEAGYVGAQSVVEAMGYAAHIRGRGEEKQEHERNPQYKARRWVVEVCHSWLNRFRKLLVRYEKRPAIIWHYYILPVPLSSGVILFQFIQDLFPDKLLIHPHGYAVLILGEVCCLIKQGKGFLRHFAGVLKGANKTF